MKQKSGLLFLLTFILINVVAVYAATTFTFKFDASGGNIGTDTLTITEGDTFDNENTPTRTDYDFAGWGYSVDALYTCKLSEIKPSHDTYLHAVWIKNMSNMYEVTYDGTNGYWDESPKVYVYATKNSTHTEPPNPQRDGYIFKGWTDTAGSTKIISTSTVTYTATLYAVWADANTGDTVTDDDYTPDPTITYIIVTYDSQGGSAVASQTIERDTVPTKPADPTLNGYTFNGWYIGNVLYDFTSTLTANTTLTAHWNAVTPLENNTPEETTPTNTRYTVTFVSGDEDTHAGSTFSDGTYYKSAQVNAGEYVAVPELPKDTISTSFDYWSQTKAGNWLNTSNTQVFTVTTTPITSNITLYATYKQQDNSSTLVTIKFDANGGKLDGNKTWTETIAKNTPVDKPDNPTRSGYSFKGWYTDDYDDDEDPDSDDKWSFSDNVTSNLSLYAAWKKKSSDSSSTPETLTSPGGTSTPAVTDNNGVLQIQDPNAVTETPVAVETPTVALTPEIPLTSDDTLTADTALASEGIPRTGVKDNGLAPAILLLCGLTASVVGGVLFMKRKGIQ